MASLRPPIRGEIRDNDESSLVIHGVWLVDSSLVWDCLFRMGLLRKLHIRICLECGS